LVGVNFLNANNYINFYLYGIDFTIINDGYRDGIHMDYYDYRPITPISEFLVGKESWELKTYYSIFGRPKVSNEYIH